MARVTIEDCLKRVDNMYELVHLATKRARMLYRGADPLVKSKNRIIVTSLREIAAGKVYAQTLEPQSELDQLHPITN